MREVISCVRSIRISTRSSAAIPARRNILFPGYVQDQLSARCRAVDSLERLHAYADQFQAKGSPELVEEIGGKAFLPPPFRP